MIKFRAWDKKTKTMYEVKSIVFTLQSMLCVNKKAVHPERTLYLDDDDTILMQSTGLVDKNGKEVFIGDIVRCTSGCPHEVYIEKEYGGTFIGGMPAIYFKGIKNGYAWTGDEEIIGNIYENPDLLESVEE